MTYKDLIFIHIPKTGGLSLREILSRTNYQYELEHYTSSEMKKMVGVNEFNKKFVFTLIRNPWDRVLSGYKYIRFGSTRTSVIRIPEFAPYYHITFNEFLDKLYDNFKKYGRPILNPECKYDTIGNKTLLTQYSFIFDEDNNKLVDLIIPLNRLKGGLDELYELTGVRLPTPRKTNISRCGDKNLELTQENVEKISEIYHKDIETFNFNPPNL